MARSSHGLKLSNNLFFILNFTDSFFNVCFLCNTLQCLPLAAVPFKGDELVTNPPSATTEPLSSVIHILLWKPEMGSLNISHQHHRFITYHSFHRLSKASLLTHVSNISQCQSSLGHLRERLPTQSFKFYSF